MNRIVITAVGAAFALAFTCASYAQTTAYTHARLIVGDGNLIENGTIVVKDGKIKAVGKIAAPAGATNVDLTGKTVMPTMLEPHVHLSQTPEGVMEDMRERAYWGVSAVLSLGMDSPEVFAMRGKQIGSYGRIFSAGRGITRPEGATNGNKYAINTPEEGIKAVREQAARKVDIIKIWVDNRLGKYEKLTPEMYGAIIKEAHKHGLRVIAHVYDQSDTKGLLKAGVDGFSHNTRDSQLDDEAIALFKQHPNVVLGANMGPPGSKVDVSFLKASLPPAEYAKLEAAANTETPALQKQWEIQAYNLRTAVDSGVKLVIGSDGNSP